MEILIAFVIGIAASAVVGYLIYRRQKSDASVSEQRIAFLMEQALKETRGASEALHSTIAIVTAQQRELQDDLSQLRTGFAAALQAFSQELARPSIVRKRPEASLRLSLPGLQQLHRDVMPPQVPYAGELRATEVRIAGSPYSPPGAPEVQGRLDKLLANWNSDLESLSSLPRELQVRRLAKFHHDFLLIHPFHDGNGAVARTLLSQQLRALVGVSKPVVFTERERYFEALQGADAGDLTQLEAIVSRLVEEPAG